MSETYIEVYGVPIFADIKEILKKLEDEGHYIGKIKTTGNNYMMVCPFHDDNDPSLGVARKDMIDYSGRKIPAGTFNCFGCSYSSDLIGFISDLKKVSGNVAYKWLVENFVVGEYKKRTIDLSFLDRQDEEEISLDDFDHYHPYMEKRGLSGNLIYMYDIRYNPEHNSIVFPIYSKDHELIGYQERGVEKKEIYSTGFVNTLFGMQWLDPEDDEVWIAEGALDALILKKFGYNSVAIMGGLSQAKLDAIGRLDYRVFVIAFDNDEAGDRYAKEVAETFSNRLVKRAFFEKGDDPAELCEDCDFTQCRMCYDEFPVTLKYMT